METNQERLKRLREKHKRKLEEIKRIKEDSNYLIGSDDANQMINNYFSIENYPNEAARLINERLEEKIFSVSYRANSGRVNGFFNSIKRGIEFASNKVNPDRGYDPDKDPSHEVCKFPGLGILNHRHQIIFDVPLKTAKLLYPFFKRANLNGITLDADFKECFISDLLIRYGDAKGRLKSAIRPKADLYIYFLAEFLKNQDWQNELSAETYQEWKNREMEYRTTPALKIEKMVERAFNEMTDNRRDVRKQIVVSWLTLQEAGSYDEAIKRAEIIIKMREESLRKCKEDGIECIIRGQKKQIEHARYIRLCLGSEKSFIEKYLKS